MSELERTKQAIRDFIAGSDVPEDPRHADNTLEWLLRLAPAADGALQIAALAHDIDRASPDKIRRENFNDYDDFKAAHARHGAEILNIILAPFDLSLETKHEACRLVEYHEVGGDPRSNLLKDADSLSYFDVNLPFYLQREGRDETLRRCIWGIRRLSTTARTMLEKIKFDDPTHTEIIKITLDASNGEDTSQSTS